MPELLILPTQHDAFFEEIQKAGFARELFEWDQSGDKIKAEFKITYKPVADFYFAFRRSGVSFSRVAMAPVATGLEWTSKKDDWQSWHDFFPKHFANWPGYFQKEIEALNRINLWATLGEVGELPLGTQEIDDNTPFTEPEQQLIADKLAELGEYLADGHSLGEDVKSRLDYVAKATTRVGRKDWLLIFNAILIDIVLQFAQSSDVAREIFRFAAQLFGVILKGFLPSP